jgi:hypothetical protein
MEKYNYISNCSSFGQQQTTMGMMPNATALSERYSHLGGRNVHLLAKTNANALADGTEKYVAYSMSP